MLEEKAVTGVAEYIEREAAQTSCRKYSFAESYDSFAVDCILKSIPAADVAPVRHGWWTEQEKYTFGTMYDCSICGNRILDNGHPWNYCPNCGAKMDGGED